MSNTHTTDSEKNLSDSDIVSKSKEVDIIIEGEVDMPGVNQVVSSAEMSPQFKCEQCNYTNISVKGLAQHTRMKHRISQVDGNIDIEKEILSTNIWKDIILSGFIVEEDLQDFKIEVYCLRQEFP
jgi:hypothetical protein